MSATGLGGYYRAITMLEKVLVADDERRWLLKMPDSPRATENLIYLGCNILKTLHLVQTLTLLLDSLGVDYLAVGGPAFCCGISHRREGNLDAGQRMFDRSQQGFEAFQPSTLVNWCPSCEERLHEMVPNLGVLPYEVVHFTEFLATLLAKVEWQQPVPLKCALHAHYGSEDSDRETAFARQLLGMIPGIEVVELSDYLQLGAHCSAQRVSGLSRPRFRQLIESQVAEARVLGAGALVSVYHSCHRELARYAAGQVEVLNYTTLVARALGIARARGSLPALLERGFRIGRGGADATGGGRRHLGGHRRAGASRRVYGPLTSTNTVCWMEERPQAVPSSLVRALAQPRTSTPLASQVVQAPEGSHLLVSKGAPPSSMSALSLPIRVLAPPASTMASTRGPLIAS